MKATWHRVLDIGVKRYSSPFFVEPKYDAVIPCNMLVPEEQQSEPAVVFGPWLVQTLKRKYAEWKDFEIDTDA